MFLGPMFDPRQSVFGLPASVAVMLGAIGLMVVGFLWLRHNVEPGPFLRGESHWRYRDRPRGQRIRQWLAEGDQSIRARTRGWWMTRLEFALAAGALVLATLILGEYAFGNTSFYRNSTLGILGTSGLGYAGILFGLRWMRRIYLAPLETDPEVGWRYRDR
jgi:hypothetical protein